MNTPYRDGIAIPAKVAQGAVIAMGVIVALNATGFAVPARDDEAKKVLGRAESDVDNTDGGDGDIYVTVTRKRQFMLHNDATTPATQADIGKTVYLTGENTVTADSTGATLEVGTLYGIETDGMTWVEIG